MPVKTPEEMASEIGNLCDWDGELDEKHAIAALRAHEAAIREDALKTVRVYLIDQMAQHERNGGDAFDPGHMAYGNALSVVLRALSPAPPSEER